MITEDKVIEIFCIMDEFCNNFASECEVETSRLLTRNGKEIIAKRRALLILFYRKCLTL